MPYYHFQSRHFVADKCLIAATPRFFIPATDEQRSILISFSVSDSGQVYF